ncbi:MAG: hypothetical protein II393_04220 [Cytophagales bacterium]|nr:hypothetical protein [Cytophagales bacterium]
MRATEENKEELLKKYVYDIYNATRIAIPKNKPSIQTLERYSQQRLISEYALTLEFITRVNNECAILLRILNNQPFKPYDIDNFKKKYEKMVEEAQAREHQEYLKEEEARKKFLQWRRGGKKED